MRKAILTVLTATMFMLFGSTTANAACPCNLGMTSQSMIVKTQAVPVVTIPNYGCAPVCGTYVVRPAQTCCPAAPICCPATPKCCPAAPVCCPAAPACSTCSPACPVKSCCPTFYNRTIVSPALPVVFGPPSDCNCR
jgi:hypothetical protein